MKNTIENTKLIVAFIGFEPVETWYEDKEMLLPQHIYDTQGGNGFDLDEMLFDTSWDWLIPVVEKMTRLAVEYNGEGERLFLNVGKRLLKLDLLATYSNVVEFVKWYNEKK